MHMKLTLAVSAFLLCISTSIRALPMPEAWDMVVERSLLDGGESDIALSSRDLSDDSLEELTARAKGSSGGKSFSAAKKNIPAAREAKKAPQIAPKAVKKSNAAEQQKAARAAKAAKQPPVVPGSKKAAKIAERKENRDLAKKQKWFAGEAAGKYKLGANGKPIDNKTPTTPEARQKRTDKKAFAKASYDKLSTKKKQDKAREQKKEQKKNAPTVAANREKKRQQTVADKAAARTTRKADRGAQMAQARQDYRASINTGTFPLRKANYVTPQKKEYSGRDVRQALFNGHAASQPGKAVGYKAETGEPLAGNKRHPKTFKNYANSNGKIPLRTMQGAGREFGIMHNSRNGFDGRSPAPSEARLITQYQDTANKRGPQVFRGVIAHPNPTSGDHVKVDKSRRRSAVDPLSVPLP